MRPHRDRLGFTLLEMMVVISIIAVVTVMTWGALRTARPRAEVSSLALDLRGALAQARAEALATGHDVAVLVYPDLASAASGTGRVVVYSDGDRTFFVDGAPLNFENYDPRTPSSGPESEVIAVLEVPRDYAFGPALGQSPAILPAPFARVPVNSDCTFCLGAGGALGRRGAVVFNYQGIARFQSENGPPSGALAGAVGGSVTLQSAVAPGEIRTIAVISATGSIRSMSKLY